MEIWRYYRQPGDNIASLNKVSILQVSGVLQHLINYFIRFSAPVCVTKTVCCPVLSVFTHWFQMFSVLLRLSVLIRLNTPSSLLCTIFNASLNVLRLCFPFHVFLRFNTVNFMLDLLLTICNCSVLHSLPSRWTGCQLHFQCAPFGTHWFHEASLRWYSLLLPTGTFVCDSGLHFTFACFGCLLSLQFSQRCWRHFFSQ